MKQFQYTGWPEEGIPDAGTGLIDLAGQVQKWQRNSGVHPIVVHCSGGSGRTGTFIAISILLERLKTEGVVDVFHTGRTLRLQRPGLIQTVVRMLFLARVLNRSHYSHRVVCMWVHIIISLYSSRRINMSFATRQCWSTSIPSSSMLTSNEYSK